jgi:membrane protein DedA with SNARE-associated domain
MFSDNADEPRGAVFFKIGIVIGCALWAAVAILGVAIVLEVFSPKIDWLDLIETLGLWAAIFGGGFFLYRFDKRRRAVRP